jgi:polyketide biosynthesis acyl carrier protein
MSKEAIFDIIVNHTREVLPALQEHRFQTNDSLRELGANSVDRADIIMMTLESLSLNIPLIDMARAQNIGELARIIYERA